MTELRTKRLVLRETDESDAGLLAKLQERDGVTDYIGELRVKRADSYLFTILRKQTRLGQIAVVWSSAVSPKGLEMVCALLPEAEGCGVATEACQRIFRWSLEEMSVTLIFARVHGENRESAALIARLGMEEYAARSADGETMYVKHLLPAT